MLLPRKSHPARRQSCSVYFKAVLSRTNSVQTGSTASSHVGATVHGSAEEGYYPHELILGYEVCQRKGTLIGVSELTLEKSYQFGLLRI